MRVPECGEKWHDSCEREKYGREENTLRADKCTRNAYVPHFSNLHLSLNSGQRRSLLYRIHSINRVLNVIRGLGISPFPIIREPTLIREFHIYYSANDEINTLR